MSQEQREPVAGPAADREGKAALEHVVRAEELFGEQREVLIDLDGVRYRLRITRRGKLILQK